MKCGGPIYDRFVGPLLLAALNIAPQEGSAKLAGAVVRETPGTWRSGVPATAGYVRDWGVFLSSPRSRICADEVLTISFKDELIELLFGNGRVIADEICQADS